MKFILSLAVVMLLLVGCKATVSTEVNLTDILDAESRTIAGNLYVEVPGCSSYEDSRNPSNSVVKAQQTIPSVFADAEYIECFSKGFNSFAHFKIPVALDKDKDGKFASENHVNIISNKDSLLWVGIPPAIKENIEKAKSSTFGAGSMDLKVDIKINNDSGKDFPFTVLAAYVDGEPYILNDLISNQNGSFVVTLSDVSVSRALQTGVAPVLNR